MSKIKKCLLVLLLTCAAVCISVAVAACAGGKNSSKYPYYKNPANADITVNENAYQIAVLSKGGLPLDGVRVEAKKNGATVMSGISINGLVQFALDLDEYELVVSDLPDGYYLEERVTFKTSSHSRQVKIEIPSTVINGTAPSGTRYAEGMIMYDFSFGSVQYDGSVEYHTLSELLETKKAVYLNFWYKGCGPCKSEFPAIETAYRSYSKDVAFVALTNQDSVKTIADFKENYYQSDYNLSLTFDMGQELAGLGTMFGVTAYPTTVVIDRYGMIAYIDTKGSQTMAAAWRMSFERFIADDYMQVVESAEKPDPGETDRPMPVYKMPPSGELAAALTGAGAEGRITACYAEADDDYSWPYSIEHDDVDGVDFVAATNTGIYNSYAILNVDISLTAGDVLSYEYNVNVAGNRLRVILNRTTDIKTYTSSSDGWQDEYAVYIADSPVTVSLYFCYLRETDEKFDDGAPELAAIRNIYITNITDVRRATDVKYNAVTKTGVDAGGNAVYGYPEVEAGADGYYRLKDGGNITDTLLLADVLGTTLWTDLHVGASTFIPAGQESPVYSSLYYLSYWNGDINVNLYNEDEEAPLIFMYGDKDCTDVIVDNFYIQRYSDSGYVPVDEELKNAMQAFTKYYCTLNNLTYYEDQWLELCSYYRHYGAQTGHNKDKEHDLCFEKDSTVEGMIVRNAFTAELDVTYTVDNYRQWPFDGGGMIYKFTAPKAGVYDIRSLGEYKAMPYLFLYNAEGQVFYDQDNDLAYDNFLKEYSDHFATNVYLEKDEVIYVRCSASFHGDPEKYDMKISYAGETYKKLIYCTTGEGLYTYNSLGIFYLAIDVAYDPLANSGEGCYRAVGAEGNAQTGDGGMWSSVYIDFVRPNFFDTGNRSVKWMIDNGIFNFGRNGNFTPTMREYYNRSVAGKTPSDETYGLIEATQELVDILNMLVGVYVGEGPEAQAWLSMACFYAYYGYSDYSETPQN